MHTSYIFLFNFENKTKKYLRKVFQNIFTFLLIPRKLFFNHILAILKNGTFVIYLKWKAANLLVSLIYFTFLIQSGWTAIM